MKEDIIQKLAAVIEALDSIAVTGQQNRGNLYGSIETLKASPQAGKKETSLLARAELYHDKVNSAMYALRVVADYLEGLTDDALWPLPSYLELLFIR